MRSTLPPSGPAPDADQLLERVHPFQFLSKARRDELALQMTPRSFESGEMVIERGAPSRWVFLLGSGEVEVLEGPPGREVVTGTIVAGHYFGERAALFDQPRLVTLRATQPCSGWSMPEQAFNQLVQNVPMFAQALADALQVKQGIFRHHRALVQLVQSLVGRGHFQLHELLDAYVRLKPALHPLVDAAELDFAALRYALPRLPESVTSSHVYFLTDALPPLYAQPDRSFEPVHSRSRRRAAWKITPGKTMVLLRDGFTDVADLLTCLCLYAVEAKKLRRKTRSRKLLQALAAREADETRLARLSKLRPDELASLQALWPGQHWQKLHDVLLHHEDIAVECNLQVENYNSQASEVWVSQIREAATTVATIDDPSLEVHIISSNTHSVSNCISPYLRRQADAILRWGAKERPELCTRASPERPWGASWARRDDLVVALAADFYAANSEEAKLAEAELRESGWRGLRQTAFTGIEVEIFDLRQLDADRVDPELGFRKPEHPALIVNVDYAFGAQAEQILNNLLCLFGRRVRSVNVLGKAGGLQGKRGDIQLARSALLQENNELYPLPGNDLTPELLDRFAPGVPVHEGSVLTVAGTLMQDTTLLHFYRRLFGCVGLEMEGSYFARRLNLVRARNAVRPDLSARFAYFTSDLPLQAESNLSQELRPWESIPALYGVTRAILAQIFKSVATPR